MLKFPIYVMIFPKGGDGMTDIRYISTKEAAGIMGLSTRRVVGLCNAGKLEGALRKGRNWKVPEETAYAYICLLYTSDAADDQ